MRVQQASFARDERIDVIKGFAILLVVLGHAIQYSVINYDENIIFRIIYSFHMPLFIFLSGYTAAFKKEINWSILKNKAKTLLLPFLSWYLIGYVRNTNISFKKYIQILILAPDNGLWFLWILFLCFVMLIIITKLTKIIGIWAYGIGIIIINIIPFNVLGIKLLAWHIPFFLLGYLINKYKYKLNNFRYITFLMIPIYLICIPFYSRIDQPEFYPWVINIMGSGNARLANVMSLGYKYAVAFAGITITIMLFFRCYKIIRCKLLQKVGQSTLYIYAIHFWLLYGLGYGVLKVISTFVCALCMSLVVSYILMQIPIARLLLFGKGDIISYNNKDINFN